MILPSCQKSIDLFQESEEGKNVLSFMFNGTPCCVKTNMQGYHSPDMTSTYDLNSNTLQIDASINGSDGGGYASIETILFDIPLPCNGQPADSMVCDALIRFLILTHISDGYENLVYEKPTVDSSWVKIRRYDYEKCICAGSFGCIGYLTGEDGQPYPFVLEDGLFDVYFGKDYIDEESSWRHLAESQGRI